ncbi:MAG: hypothetical protein ACRERD_09105 [Candidatus Binatia bacterium]
MKRQFFTLFTAGVVCLSLTAGAFAGSPRTDSEKAQVVMKLEDRAQQLAWRAQELKAAKRPSDSLTVETQRLQVQSLIERIRAGESLSPREIDALLGTGPQ